MPGSIVGLQVGQSRRWGFEQIASGMDRLPDTGQEISLSGSFLIC